MAPGLIARAAARLYGFGWETRRRAYAAGWLESRRVRARVVSIGNLTTGGAGKTTLTLHLARVAIAAGRQVAVICRDYRPGPAGRGDEALLFERALGRDRVFSGRSKSDLAASAAARGCDLLLIDDGFSHWKLTRDVDLVLLDARDPWGGNAWLPAGRLREPQRALQRARAVVVTRVEDETDARRQIAQLRGYAPAAQWGAARHRIEGVRGLGGDRMDARGPAHVVTATGHPEAVAASAREAGFEPVTLAAFRDHHWFRADEVAHEIEVAARSGATVVITAKDEVRWPRTGAGSVAVLEVAWEWVLGGAPIEALALEGREE